MRPKGTKEKLEARRRRAAAMLRAGGGVRQVARRLGVSPASVSRWKKNSRRGGGGLKAKPQARRMPALTPPQMNRLARFIARPPASHGFKAKRWTLELVARLIKKHFRIAYHPGHVWRILRAVRRGRRAACFHRRDR